MAIEDTEILNAAGRTYMVEGYKETPQGHPDSEYFSKAEQLFKKAHNLSPDNPHYALNVADALFALGQTDEANEYFSKAVTELKPDSKHLAGVKRRWGIYIKGMKIVKEIKEYTLIWEDDVDKQSHSMEIEVEEGKDPYEAAEKILNSNAGPGKGNYLIESIWEGKMSKYIPPKKQD